MKTLRPARAHRHHFFAGSRQFFAGSRQQEQEQERGAAMVEFAVVSVILVLFIFGIIEGGLAFRAKLAMSNSADEAARQGSIEGSHPYADYEVLRSVIKHSVSPDTITKVVVFKAVDGQSPPSDACLIASSAGDNCNHYTPADFDRPRTDFGKCGPIDGAWCPSSRYAAVRDGDLLGVWIEGKFDSPSGALGSMSFEELSVLPLESRGQ